MKKAVAIPPAAVVVAKKETKAIVRICKREGCGKPLKRGGKNYCSRVCSRAAGEDGRPTKFEKRFVAEVQAYVEHCAKGNDPTLIPTKGGYITIPNAEVPTKDGFRLWLRSKFKVKPSAKTLQNWEDAHADLAVEMEYLMSAQKVALINYGAAGRYAPHIPRLMLSFNHGMHEKKLVDKRIEAHAIGIVKHVYAAADEVDLPPMEQLP